MYRHIDFNSRLVKNQQDIDAANEESANNRLVSSIVFVTLAETEMIDDVTATEHYDLFVTWESGVSYAVGNIRRHNGELYKCLQAHTSQDDWTPDVSPSLWKKIGDPTEEYPAWSQPISAEDAYMTGDKVTDEGRRWMSNIDNNVWKPGVYGWEAVE